MTVYNYNGGFMTTIYLIRHSEGFQKLQGNILTKDSVQLINEKNPLSVGG